MTYQQGSRGHEIWQLYDLRQSENRSLNPQNHEYDESHFQLVDSSSHPEILAMSALSSTHSCEREQTEFVNFLYHRTMNFLTRSFFSKRKSEQLEKFYRVKICLNFSLFIFLMTDFLTDFFFLSSMKTLESTLLSKIG